MKTAAISFSAALLIACGTRSGLLDERPRERELDASGPDAGSRLDAGPAPFDGGVRPPEACFLSLSVNAQRAFIGGDGESAHASQVAWRDDRLDVIASLYALGSDTPRGSRGDGYSTELMRIDQWFVTSPRERHLLGQASDRLALCGQGGASGEALLTVLDPLEAHIVTRLFADAECAALAGGDDGWLVAVTPPGDVSPQFSVRDLDGREVSAFGPSSPEHFSGGRIAVTGTEGGYAYAVTGPNARAMRVRFLSARGEVLATQDVDEIGPGISAPAIAPWPFVPGQVAVAVWSGGLRVIVVDPMRGEVLRSEELAFSMDGDMAPALVAHPNALFVASLGYGDADPRGGFLRVQSLGARTQLTAQLDRPTRRSADLRWGGVDLATDGDRVAVHWTEWLDDMAGGRGVTQLMLFDCL